MKHTLNTGPGVIEGRASLLLSSLMGVLSISPQVIKGDSDTPGAGEGVPTNP